MEPVIIKKNRKEQLRLEMCVHPKSGREYVGIRVFSKKHISQPKFTPDKDKGFGIAPQLLKPLINGLIRIYREYEQKKTVEKLQDKKDPYDWDQWVPKY